MLKLSVLLLLCLSPVAYAQNSQFYGSLTRDELQTYMSRSLAVEFDGINKGMAEYNDIINFAARSDARYLGTCYGVGYGSELPVNHGYFDIIHSTVLEINKAYIANGFIPPIIGGSIWEKVTHDVDSIWMNDEVANTYNVPKRRFIFDSIKYITDTNKRIATPDISRIETQMYFYFLATKFIDAGMEAIHMGIIELEDLNDSGHVATWDILCKIRKYASTRNRGLVLLNADTYGLHLRNTDTLLYDFNTRPTRVSGYYSGKDSTWHSMWIYYQSAFGGPGRLSYNECSPYGKMAGGWSPLGWHADTMPYIVVLDNTLTNNCNCLVKAGCWTVYGFDEISWFTMQNEEYRNQWLCYAYSYVKMLDRNGNFMMPCRTLFTRRWTYYTAVNGYGYDQEDEIVKIWSGEEKDCDPNNIPDFKALWNDGDSNKISVIVYPNPVKGIAKIVYNTAKGDKVNISIFDTFGKKVTEWPTGKNEGYIEWNTVGLTQGTYFLTASDDRGRVTPFKVFVTD